MTKLITNDKMDLTRDKLKRLSREIGYYCIDKGNDLENLQVHKGISKMVNLKVVDGLTDKNQLAS